MDLHTHPLSEGEQSSRDEKISPEMKELSKKYHFPNEEEDDLKGTIKDKRPMQSALYVDTHYIDFMLSNMEEERLYEMNELKRKT